MMTSGGPKEKRARDGVRDACAMLQNALLDVRAMPPSGTLGAIAGALTEAVAELTKVLATSLDDPEYFVLFDQAQAIVSVLSERVVEAGSDLSLEAVARSVDSVSTRLGVCRELSLDAAVTAQQEGLGRELVGSPPGELDGRFVGSVGMPTLHRLPRAPLAPLMEPPPRQDSDPIRRAARAARGDFDDPALAALGAKTVDDVRAAPLDALAAMVARGEGDEALEDDDEPPAVTRADSPPELELSPGEKEHLSWTARDCLNSLAGLSNLRVPWDDAPWTNGEPFEARLLETLDCLLALGTPPRPADRVGWNVLAEVQRFGWDSYVPDFGRQFTRALALCCVEGSDTVRAALMALRQINPATHASVQEALSLAPSPAIGPQLTELLRESDPDLIPLFLDVLRFRRETNLASLTLLSAHPSLSVARAVTRSLGYVEPSAAVLATLRGSLDEEGDDPTCLEAATSLLRLGDELALNFVRAKLADRALLPDTARQGYLRLMALAGSSEDAALFHNALGYGPRDTQLVGWYGHSGLVDWLVMALEAANELREATGPWPYPVELAVVDSLYRITGAPVKDEPFDDVQYDFQNRPALKASTWMRWWEGHADEFDTTRRYRFGKPYSPAATLDELSNPSTITEVRRDAALELEFAVGPSRFEAGDWVARQRVALDEVRARLERGNKPYAPGAFIADQLKRRDQYVG